LGEHQEAIEDFSNAINYASDLLKEEIKINYLHLRGKEYMELLKYDRAIDDFTESLHLRVDCYTPQYNNILLMRGKTYYLLGEIEKTKTDIEECLNLKRKAADAWGRRMIPEFLGVNLEEILKEENSQENDELQQNSPKPSVISEEEVRKGFKEAVDDVVKYFGWDKVEIIPDKKDKEEHDNCSLCGTENNIDNMLELQNGDCICLKCYNYMPEKEKENIRNDLKLEDGVITQKNIDLLLSGFGKEP